MTPTVRWFRLRSPTWHAWVPGADTSLCGRIARTHVEQGPVKGLGHQPPPQAKFVCARCTARVEVVRGPSATPTLMHAPAVQEWLRIMHLRLTAQKITRRPKQLLALAQWAARFADPTTHGALGNTDDLALVVTWVLYPRGRRRDIPLRSTLPLLPTDAAGVQQLVKVLRAWERASGQSVLTERAAPSRVLTGLQRLPPGAEWYVTHLYQKGLTPLGAIFHPNTIDRARSDPKLRAYFLGGSVGSGKVRTDDLYIVTE